VDDKVSKLRTQLEAEQKRMDMREIDDCRQDWRLQQKNRCEKDCIIQERIKGMFTRVHPVRSSLCHCAEHDFLLEEELKVPLVEMGQKSRLQEENRCAKAWLALGLRGSAFLS
jgi:hypothetical protein